MLIVRPAVSSQRAAAEARQPGRKDTGSLHAAARAEGHERPRLPLIRYDPDGAARDTCFELTALTSPAAIG